MWDYCEWGQCERRVEDVPSHLFSFVGHQFLSYLGAGQKTKEAHSKGKIASHGSSGQ